MKDKGERPPALDEDTAHDVWLMSTLRGDVPLVEVLALLMIAYVLPKWGVPTAAIRYVLNIRDWAIRYWPRPKARIPNPKQEKAKAKPKRHGVSRRGKRR